MKELSLQQQCEISGGIALSTALWYLLMGTALYKLYKSKRGRISLPRLIKFEWSN